MATPKPFRQGDLDALCGLYAVVNAVIVLCPDFSDRESLRLFRLLTQAAAVRRKRFDEIVRTGTEGSMLRHLVRVAAGDLEDRRRLFVDTIRPRSDDLVNLKSALSFLRRNVSRNSVAIIMIRDEELHWTVTTKVTEKLLYLFDSSDSGPVSIQNCTIGSKQRDRVRLHPKEFIVLRRVNPGWPARRGFRFKASAFGATINPGSCGSRIRG